jgi:uncharacterized membrane-anchored protein
MDANSVARLYRNRISGLALVLLVIAAAIAVVAALSVADTNHTYFDSLQHDWDNVANWIQDKFS